MELLADSKAWVALSFITFMAIFFRYAIPPILGGLDARSARIKNELNEAVRLKEEAQTLLADFQQKQKEMKAEAESILAMAKKEAEATRKQAEANMRASIERRTTMAHEKIARAEAEALAGIQATIVDLSVDATHHLLASELTDEQRASLIQDSLSDIKRLMH